MQPITGWLSLVGAAATNAATVGGTALRDDLDRRRARSFAPVLAIGVRISRLPSGGANGTPGGILAFETRTLGAVDSLAVEQGASAPDGDTLRVVLLIDAPRAESVELMGDATEWITTRMQRTTNGRWRAELKLAPGMHRITVRADGGAFTQPRLRQCQRERQRAVAVTGVHQQRMAALRRQCPRQRLGQPGQRQLAVVAHHQGAHHARPIKAASSCCQTCSRAGSAFSRTNRCGSDWQRCS